MLAGVELPDRLLMLEQNSCFADPRAPGRTQWTLSASSPVMQQRCPFHWRTLNSLWKISR